MPSHVIETDFESDDAIAILAHATKYTGINLSVVVGESKPCNKIHRVTKFIEAVSNKYPLAYSSVNIVQGFGSNKDYPDEDEVNANEDNEQVILDNYTKIYASEPELAFMMKPPREAMKLKLHCPKTTVYCYGSFNWRTLKLPVKEYQDLMSRYEKFYYFDSFTAIGEKNSALFKGPSNEVNDKIVDIIVKWNQLILTKCEQGLKEKSEDGLKRRNKIIENLKTGMKEQYVMADVCLMLCPLPTERVKLSEFDTYPKWTPSDSGSVFIFNSDTETRRLELLENLTKIAQ